MIDTVFLWQSGSEVQQPAHSPCSHNQAITYTCVTPAVYMTVYMIHKCVWPGWRWRKSPGREGMHSDHPGGRREQPQVSPLLYHCHSGHWATTMDYNSQLSTL